MSSRVRTRLLNEANTEDGSIVSEMKSYSLEAVPNDGIHVYGNTRINPDVSAPFTASQEITLRLTSSNFDICEFSNSYIHLNLRLRLRFDHAPVVEGEDAFAEMLCFLVSNARTKLFATIPLNITMFQSQQPCNQMLCMNRSYTPPSWLNLNVLTRNISSHLMKKLVFLTTHSAVSISPLANLSVALMLISMSLFLIVQCSQWKVSTNSATASLVTWRLSSHSQLKHSFTLKLTPSLPFVRASFLARLQSLFLICLMFLPLTLIALSSTTALNKHQFLLPFSSSAVTTKRITNSSSQLSPNSQPSLMRSCVGRCSRLSCFWRCYSSTAGSLVFWTIRCLCSEGRYVHIPS